MAGSHEEPSLVHPDDCSMQCSMKISKVLDLRTPDYAVNSQIKVSDSSQVLISSYSFRVCYRSLWFFIVICLCLILTEHRKRPVPAVLPYQECARLVLAESE